MYGHEKSVIFYQYLTLISEVIQDRAIGMACI